MTEHELMLAWFGPWEMGAIAVIALLLFGRRLPEVMRGLGTGMRQFRKGLDGADDDEPAKLKDGNQSPPVTDGSRQDATPSPSSGDDASSAS